MSQFRDASSNGSLRPPEDTGSTYPIPQRPERIRQWAQFAGAAAVFIFFGVVLSQIIGGGSSDEPEGSVGTTLDTTVTAPAMLPTPDESGAIVVETYDEARALVPFELVQPGSLPASMELAGIELFFNDLVNAYYRFGASDPVINFIQTNRTCSDTNVNTVAYEDIEIGGEVVRRGLGTDAGGRPLASYRWTVDDVCLNVLASLVNGVDEDLLEAFVLSILAEDSNGNVDATPTIAQSPTPDETGAFRAATFDEAQPLTPFELVEPATVPEGLALEGIRLWTAPDQSTVEAATAGYRHDDSGEVQFWQTLDGCFDTGFNDATNDDVEIGDRIVRRLSGMHDDGNRFISYTWQTSELCYTVVGTLTGGISEETLISFVASVPTLDAVIVQTPPAGPAFTGPEYATLSVSPDYVTCEDEVIARGMGFSPGTTVVIFGGQLPGDNFAPVTDDIAVGDDGSFETPVDLNRLIGECRGADIQMGGMLFRLGADTGSTQTKEDEEGPSASTVVQYRYEGEVPDVVKHREWLPTCGTEVWIEDTAPELASDPDIAGRQCFVDAVSKGIRAEFVSLVRTGEGWFSKLIYRSLGNNIVETFADTSGAKFGEVHWSTRTCTGGAESIESDLFAIRLLECSEQEPIE